MALSNPRVEQLVREEIGRISGKKIPQSVGPSTKKVMIVCPYHNDHNPSGTINLDDTKAAMGYFSCWSCGTKARWNELAQRLGLKKIDGAASRKQAVSEYEGSERWRDQLFGDQDTSTDRKLAMTLNSLHEKPWPFDEWRGYSVRFLKKVGAKYVYDDFKKEKFVAFPVYINEELCGIVRARIKKSKDKSVTSYLNSPGSWSGSKGLLFFDYAKAMMERQGHKTIVLCEGPRDALRLLKNKIPAICVLGSSNWDESKTFTFEMLGADNVVLFFDGDRAGYKAALRVHEHLKGRFVLKAVRLWEVTKTIQLKSGKTKEVPAEYDPGNCPFKYIRRVQRYVESTIEE